MPAALAMRLISRILAIDTGWPPPELLVTVTMMTGISSGPCSATKFSSASVSMLPLNGKSESRSSASLTGQVDRIAAHEVDVAARGVKVRVVGHKGTGFDHDAKQDVLGSAALVRRDDLLETEDVLDRVAEAEPAARAGVGLVAAHHCTPGLGRHGAGTGIGQQVDDDVLGTQQERVVVRVADQLLALSRVVSLMGSTILIRKGSMIVFMDKY